MLGAGGFQLPDEPARPQRVELAAAASNTPCGKIRQVTVEEVNAVAATTPRQALRCTDRNDHCRNNSRAMVG